MLSKKQPAIVMIQTPSNANRCNQQNASFSQEIQTSEPLGTPGSGNQAKQMYQGTRSILQNLKHVVLSAH
jgi:hypothetical protein